MLLTKHLARFILNTEMDEKVHRLIKSNQVRLFTVMSYIGSCFYTPYLNLTHQKVKFFVLKAKDCLRKLLFIGIKDKCGRVFCKTLGFTKLFYLKVQPLFQLHGPNPHTLYSL